MSSEAELEQKLAQLDAALHGDVRLRLTREDKLRFIRARKGVVADAAAMANNWGVSPIDDSIIHFLSSITYYLY